MAEDGRKPRRRTQQERRETTRAALLDATIDCLVEYGFAATTTIRIVERAGVSRGAQVHHFATKAELVGEALARLAQRRVAEIAAEMEELPRGPDRLGALLDLVWRQNSGPLFAASLELWVAARTDPELRAALLPAEREVIALIRDAVDEELPTAPPEQRDAIVTLVVTMMLGLGVQNELLQNEAAAEASWLAIRDQLVSLLSSLPAD